MNVTRILTCRHCDTDWRVNSDGSGGCVGAGCPACVPQYRGKCPRCGQPLRRTVRGGLVCDRWDCKVTEEVKA